jgi:hypothetical protein
LIGGGDRERIALKMRPRLACLAVLALAALGFGAPVASADSLVFVRANNVWIANQDGSGQFQVTLDGTSAAPYEYPSEADDGTIVAVRAAPGQRRQLYRMHQNGGLLNPPINTPAPGTGAINAKVSPDGRYVAYWFVTTVNDPICAFCVNVASQALISHSDRFTGPDEAGLTPNTGAWPTWMSNGRLLLSQGSANEWFYNLGDTEGQHWFDDSSLENLSAGEASRTGGRLAIVHGNSQEKILLYSFTSPPGLPIASCELTQPSGHFDDPVWTNDGSTLGWQEDDGVWTERIVSVDTCAADPAKLLIPGGSSPDFGPAPVNPGPRPGCGNPGNPAACGGPPPCPGCNPPPCCTPPGPSLAAQLRGLLGTQAKALKKLKLRGLRKRGAVKIKFTAPGAGLLAMKLTRKSTVLAGGRHRYAAAGKGTLTLKLSKKGKRAVRTARKLKVMLSATFTPRGGKAVSARKTVQLKR